MQCFKKEKNSEQYFHCISEWGFIKYLESLIIAKNCTVIIKLLNLYINKYILIIINNRVIK